MHVHPRLTTPVFGLAVSILSCLGFPTPAATPAQSPPASKPRVIQNVPYVKPAGKKIDPRQTLDLYLPQKSKTPPPLVIFIHGGFWMFSDDKYRIGQNLAEALAPSGVAVALVRYRLAPAHPHPAQAEDVAAATAYLAREANRHGYDARRIFLVGHSTGAHLAALVALDPVYLAAHRVSPQSLAGVVCLSGIYDLQPIAEAAQEDRTAVQQAFGDSPEKLNTASPIVHASGAAPPFLILSAESDLPGFSVNARTFANALRGAGHKAVEQYLMPDRDHFSLVQLAGADNKVRSLLLEFTKVAPLPEKIAWFYAAKRRWRDPPFSTLPLRRNEKLLLSLPVDRRLAAKLVPVYETMRYELLDLPLESYAAIDLLAYLDSLPPEKIGRGNYITITNARNEKLFWDRRRVEAYKPVIVVGIDDESELFRMAIFYRVRREYSWKDGPPPEMARPLGAFIHFLEEPPPEFAPQAAHYGLTENSFQLTEQDPLEPLRHLPPEVYDALTFRNGCVYCHSVRGIGTQSHHITATDASRHGGFALPLESYPPEVWRAFIFNQHEVAAKMGASPNIVDEDARQALYDLVEESREQRTSPVK